MKRGQNLNITTIIILILAILVLLLLVISFTGGFTALWKRITGQKEEAGGLEKSAAIEWCTLYYSIKNKKEFCEIYRSVIGIGNVTCKDLFVTHGFKTDEINSTVASDFCSS
jgi:hypothetical protein